MRLHFAMAESGDGGASRDALSTADVTEVTVPGTATGRAHTTALPRHLTSFVGREDELAEIARLLEVGALVTLTGTGGVGKTRLALRTASGTAGAYPDGVRFVDLAPLAPHADSALVVSAVLAALGVGESSGQPALATLTAYLEDRRTLVILDNCEHVLE